MRYSFNDLETDLHNDIAKENALETSGVINLCSLNSSSENSSLGLGPKTDLNDPYG